MSLRLNCKMELLPTTNLSLEDRLSLLKSYLKDFPLSPWSQNYFFSFLSDSSRSSLGFCIKENDVLIGFILGRLLSKDSSVFCLSALWIDSDLRGKGLGGELVKNLIFAISSRKKIKKIILHFRDANDLKDFYSRLGFSGHTLCGIYSNGDLKHYMELNV
ncbi:MAG TPA: hypothetical protein DIT25_01680 [Candidatus Moranbacteria bacterium]|nr:hypothetical protein [Candidatus Moranbacteria bacterium]